MSGGIHIEREPWSGEYGVLFVREYGGKRYVARPFPELIFDAVPDGGVIQGPTLRLLPSDLQDLADEITKLGVKTENIHKIEGVLEATKAHLEDMRKLVFEEKPTFTYKCREIK